MKAPKWYLKTIHDFLKHMRDFSYREQCQIYKYLTVIVAYTVATEITGIKPDKTAQLELWLTNDWVKFSKREQDTMDIFMNDLPWKNPDKMSRLQAWLASRYDRCLG